MSAAAVSTRGGAHTSEAKCEQLVDEATCLAQGRYSQLLEYLQEQELQQSSFSPAGGAEDVAAQVLCALLAGKVSEAMLCYRRRRRRRRRRLQQQGAAAAAADGMIAALLPVITAAVDRSFRETYVSLGAFDWPTPRIVAFVNCYRQATRATAFQLVSSSFSTISADQLADMLGISDAEAIEQARNAGWQVSDDGFKMVRPVPIDKPALRELSGAQLEQLTTYASHLERTALQLVQAKSDNDEGEGGGGGGGDGSS